MATVVVGCPMHRREWIIDLWARHAATAVRNAGHDPYFVVAAEEDDPGVPILRATVADLDAGGAIIKVTGDRTETKRDWHSPGRLERMVELRNTLMTMVRVTDPALYWSLDSDILAHPEAFVAMVHMLDRFDAVGGACFMTAEVGVRGGRREILGGRGTASYGIRTKQGWMRRTWQPGIELKVDVIMASKLMTPEVYRGTNYVYDREGEDVGWSRAARSAGFRLGWTSRCLSRHVMDPSHLDLPDTRCDSHLRDLSGCLR